VNPHYFYRLKTNQKEEYRSDIDITYERFLSYAITNWHDEKLRKSYFNFHVLGLTSYGFCIFFKITFELCGNTCQLGDEN
jgi:hypothetical protein